MIKTQYDKESEKDIQLFGKNCYCGSIYILAYIFSIDSECV